MEPLVDTCVFIDVFRGNRELAVWLRDTPCVVSAVTLMELYQGARNALEVRQIERTLHSFKHAPLDADISATSVALMKSYAKSHGLIIPDALIAATALSKSIPLVTYNIRDFRFIPKLELTAP